MAFRYKQRPCCKFIGCENNPTLGMGGYCYLHEKYDPGYERKQKKAAVKKDEKKIKMLINSNEAKLIQNAGANEFQLLQNFFFEAAKELAKNPRCQECGAYIPVQYYRASTAHVLPKRKDYGFPSVATHPLNRIFLGAGCGCHDRYDGSWEDASKMKVWPLAVEIFIMIYPFIIPSEHKNIPEILRLYIPNG